MEDILTCLLLNTPVDVLVDIYRGKDDGEYETYLSIPYVENKLSGAHVIKGLCDIYLDEIHTTFLSFLLAYDKKYNFRDVPTDYFLKRWKLIYPSALVAIPHIG